jgi:catechol 2,3-dioxygenase-like lactoylglutathione lyase family enzyme
MSLKLGTIGHIVIAVRNPRRSAKWWVKNLNLRKEFEWSTGVVVGNDEVGIALFRGTPRPQALDHVSFHLRNMKELRAALAELKRKGVELEDPGDEIGPEAPGSRNIGLWFRDPDGYRWELSVLAAPAKSKRKKSKK